jgi:hypothetical protein
MGEDFPVGTIPSGFILSKFTWFGYFQETLRAVQRREDFLESKKEQGRVSRL